MKKIASRTIAFLIATVLVAGLLAWLWPRGPSIDEVFETPETNAYPEIVRLSQNIHGSPPSEEAEMDELQKFITANSNILEGIRRNLPKQSAVPVQFTQNYAQTHFKKVSRLKALAKLLITKARLHEERGNFSEAAEVYVDVIDFGHMITRNGLLIDWMVGASAAEAGYNGLQEIAENLSKATCQKCITRLEKMENRREQYEAILQRERTWSRKVGGFRGMLVRLVQPSRFEKMEKRLQSKYHAARRRAATTLTNLATRAYRVDHGNSPQSAKALVPDYLSRVPEAISASNDKARVQPQEGRRRTRFLPGPSQWFCRRPGRESQQSDLSQ